MGLKEKADRHELEILDIYRKLHKCEDRIEELNDLIRILVEVIKEYEKKVDEKLDVL